MLRRRRQDAAGSRELAELAALADGSMSSERRVELEDRVAASAELADLLAEQERAVALVRSAAGEVEAPATLRTQIDANRRVRRMPARRSVALSSAAAMAMLALAVGLTLFGSDTSDERLYAALAATSAAPGAGGEARLTKTSSGWRVELDASGLPRLDAGRFYEAWLRNSAGVLVPIGTFNEGRNVTLWAGVSPKEFTTLTITREHADGDQGSSGEKILAGVIDTRG